MSVAYIVEHVVVAHKNRLQVPADTPFGLSVKSSQGELEMSQVGQAHKMMMLHMEWAYKELIRLESHCVDEEYRLKIAMLHLENALRIAEQIDSGSVYHLSDE